MSQGPSPRQSRVGNKLLDVQVEVVYLRSGDVLIVAFMVMVGSYEVVETSWKLGRMEFKPQAMCMTLDLASSGLCLIGELTPCRFLINPIFLPFIILVAIFVPRS